MHWARTSISDKAGPSTTITSIDGISAFDTISRTAMMSGLAEVDPSVLPFVRLFYGSKSRYLWEDDEGNCHTRRPVNVVVVRTWTTSSIGCSAFQIPSKREFDGPIYLDDNHVVSSPERVEHVHTALEEELFRHSHIPVHAGKTRV